MRISKLVPGEWGSLRPAARCWATTRTCPEQCCWRWPTTAIPSRPAAELACYDESAAGWVVEPMRYTIWRGPSFRSENLLKSEFTIDAD